jgi:hypothetical protein
MCGATIGGSVGRRRRGVGQHIEDHLNHIGRFHFMHTTAGIRKSIVARHYGLLDKVVFGDKGRPPNNHS